MISNKENKVRRQIPNRMPSATFTLPIDGRRVVGIVNYDVTETGNAAGPFKG